MIVQLKSKKIMTTKTWSNDPTHSEVHFKVKHLMITTVTGYFREFSARATTQENDFSGATVSFEAKTASIDTNNQQRDDHLRSADFFDSANYPEMRFVSASVEKAGDDQYKLHGNLTIKDVTSPVTLDVEFAGMMKDPWGNEKAGFSLSGKINRKDWDLTWNAALETGGVLVSDEVRLYAEIQLVADQN
jgi:polyisoprenoid-binding protein YceI